MSYFPAVEIKDKPNVDWIESVLLPLLQLVAKRRNKRIREVPITFWAFTRKTARPFREEMFLGVTPANLNSIAYNAIEEVLSKIEDGKVFAGLEHLPEYALPICRVSNGKVTRFYYDADLINRYMAFLARLVPASVILYWDSEDAKKYYLPAVRWVGDALMVTFSEIDQYTEALRLIHEDKN